MSDHRRINKEAKHRSSWKRRLLIFLVFLTVLVAVPVYLLINNVDSKMNIADTSDYLPSEGRPTLQEGVDESIKNRAFNFVLFGIDSGQKLEDGTTSETGMRSDTTVVAHVSKDRKNVDLISIPRDSMVEIPSCMRSDGSFTSYQAVGQFNGAFALGDTKESAIACSIKTIEENTGVYIDGYATVDFQGFSTIVDAMGGVEVYTDEHIVASNGKLDLTPGTHLLDGESALEYARARKFTVGGTDGSDLARIDRQQYLMSQMLEKASSPDIIANPAKAMDVLSTSLDAMIVSPNIGSVNKVAPLAMDLKDAKIRFHTIPVESYPLDRNRVVWSDDADSYWQSIINDTPITDTNDLTDLSSHKGEEQLAAAP